jgi:hypothetical protein
LYGWLAEVNERPVGFILLQPDLASILRQTKGGRHLLWRLWFNWASHKPSQRGRILFAGVLPEWRGKVLVVNYYIRPSLRLSSKAGKV